CGPQLRTQAADIDVDRTISAARFPPPDLGIELLASKDPLRVGGKDRQQLQLPHRQAKRATVDQGCMFLGPDFEHEEPASSPALRQRLRGREAAVNYL